MLSFLLNRPIVSSVLAAGLLVGVFGAQGRPNTNQAVSLPDGVVVFGAEHLVLEQGTNVLSGDTASNKTAVLQRETLLLGSLLTDRAMLGFEARILGNLEADRITGPNFTVEGETISPRETDDFAIPELPAFTPGTENVRIKTGETATLQPGAFNRINIEEDANVTLQGGTYDLRSLKVSHDVVFNLNEPVTLNIQQHVSFGNRTIFNLAPDLDINDIRINYAGTSVVTFGKDTFAAGVIHAPSGTIFLHKDSTWRGQFAARRVGVGKESFISREIFFNLPTRIDQVVEDPEGRLVVVNEILVNLEDGFPVSALDPILAAVEGRVAGFIDLTNEYKIRIEATNIETLDQAIATITALNVEGVEIVSRNGLVFPD